MLSELDKAIKEFDTLSDKELGYYEGEILAFAFHVNGQIEIENNYYLKLPYVKIGNQYFNSNPRTNANYRSALARAIRKGFVERWTDNNFLLTKKGWDKAETIVDDIKRNH